MAQFVQECVLFLALCAALNMLPVRTRQTRRRGERQCTEGQTQPAFDWCECLEIQSIFFLTHAEALNLYRSLSPTASDQQQILESKPLVLRVLPTMTLRTLRVKTCRTLKLKATVLFWLQQPDRTLVELGLDRDQQDIDWLGLDDGASVVFHVIQT
jgi:hypothetical protein